MPKFQSGRSMTAVFFGIVGCLVIALGTAWAQRMPSDLNRRTVEQPHVQRQCETPRADEAHENPPKVYAASEIRRLHKAQTATIDRLIDAMPKGPPKGREEEPRVFFLGIAAYAEQDVFNREIRSIRQIMNRQFGATSRSLLLINHPSTIDEYPIASLETIEYALAGLAGRMNTERDILVLYITTHGLPERLALSNGNLVSEELTAKRFARALDRSKIVNRVLIVSACHSSSFVEHLKGDDTAVLTAARADRTSFGCSNERAWTFFGDALFNRALRETPDIVEAFDRARTLISAWEKADNVEPSLPQIFVGRRIKSKLTALARQRARD